MKINFLLICAVGLALLAPTNANADIFALYDFEDGAPGGLTQSVFPNPATTVTPSAYDTRAGATQNSSSNPFGFIATPPGGGDVHAFVEADETPDSIDFGSNAAYHTFSVTTPTGPGTYALDSLHFEYWVAGADPNAEYTASLYSNLTGFPLNSTAASGFLLDQVSAETDPTESRTRSIDLRGVTRAGGFNNIPGGQTIEFRILFSDNSAGLSGTDHHRIDDVTLRGRLTTSAVPEPAASVLVLLVGGIVALRRRRN